MTVLPLNVPAEFHATLGKSCDSQQTLVLHYMSPSDTYRALRKRAGIQGLCSKIEKAYTVELPNLVPSGTFEARVQKYHETRVHDWQGMNSKETSDYTGGS